MKKRHRKHFSAKSGNFFRPRFYIIVLGEDKKRTISLALVVPWKKARKLPWKECNDNTSLEVPISSSRILAPSALAAVSRRFFLPRPSIGPFFGCNSCEMEEKGKPPASTSQTNRGKDPIFPNISCQIVRGYSSQIRLAFASHGLVQYIW